MGFPQNVTQRPTNWLAVPSNPCVHNKVSEVLGTTPQWLLGAERGWLWGWGLSQEGEHGEQVIVYSAQPCWAFGVDVFSLLRWVTSCLGFLDLLAGFVTSL